MAQKSSAKQLHVHPRAAKDHGETGRQRSKIRQRRSESLHSFQPSCFMRRSCRRLSDRGHATRKLLTHRSLRHKSLRHKGGGRARERVRVRQRERENQSSLCSDKHFRELLPVDDLHCVFDLGSYCTWYHTPKVGYTQMRYDSIASFQQLGCPSCLIFILKLSLKWLLIPEISE